MDRIGQSFYQTAYGLAIEVWFWSVHFPVNLARQALNNNSLFFQQTEN
jgi:hypothetical protein